MRKLIVLSFVVAVAIAVDGSCTRHNPLSCCTTDAQCQMFGLDKQYACDGSLVCNANGACVMPDCQTSADCTSPSAPVCIGQLCVPLCGADADCVGITGKPHCASDGACVGCLTNNDCGSDAPICDATARACRGCAQDSECSGGVCLEANGTCQADAGVIFLITNGLDTGTCTRAAPCGTLQYALQQLKPTRTVVHVDAAALQLGSSTVTLGTSFYLDGTNTVLSGTGSGALIDIAGFAHVVISNASVSKDIVVENASLLTAYNLHVSSATISTSGGEVFVQASAFDEGAVSTTNASLTVQRSTFQTSANQIITVTGGQVTLENNLVVARSAGIDAISILSSAPGSTLRFNTIVNTAPNELDDAALGCDSGIDVTSNVFAYRSMHPITGTTCSTRFSLFDSAALPSVSAGVMNKVGPFATFFANSGGSDYHPASDSPALKSGESNLGVTVDLDGATRPGASPDIGALQAR